MEEGGEAGQDGGRDTLHPLPPLPTDLLGPPPATSHPPSALPHHSPPYLTIQMTPGLHPSALPLLPTDLPGPARPGPAWPCCGVLQRQQEADDTFVSGGCNNRPAQLLPELQQYPTPFQASRRHTLPALTATGSSKARPAAAAAAAAAAGGSGHHPLYKYPSGGPFPYSVTGLFPMGPSGGGLFAMAVVHSPSLRSPAGLKPSVARGLTLPTASQRLQWQHSGGGRGGGDACGVWGGRMWT